MSENVTTSITILCKTETAELLEKLKQNGVTLDDVIHGWIILIDQSCPGFLEATYGETAKKILTPAQDQRV